jgi:hypothetical protein
MAAIVIVTAMVAVSFGGYATSLFVGESASHAWNHLFITLLLVVLTGVNLVGTRLVAAAQSVIVLCVLVSFAIFIWVTVTHINLDLLAFSGYPSASKILAAVALTFFAARVLSLSEWLMNSGPLSRRIIFGACPRSLTIRSSTLTVSSAPVVAP